MLRTTHEEYLVAFSVVQKISGIGREVLKICEFQRCEFGIKIPNHAPFGEFVGETETFAVLSL